MTGGDGALTGGGGPVHDDPRGHAHDGPDDELVVQVRAWTAPGRPPLVPEVTLLLANDIHRTWSAADTEAPPFWAFAWAGGQALARHVLDHPETVAGRRVLDLACGSGLVALAALRAGAAHAVASDSDARARVATLLNAELAGTPLEVVGNLLLAEGDDQHGDPDDDPPPEIDVDVILAGDVFYEQPMARRMAEFLDEAVGAGVDVLVGDPGREYLPRRRVTPLASYDVPDTADLEGRAVTTTTVHRLR